jgi:hypothetical protein
MPRKRPRTKAAKKRAARIREDRRLKRLGISDIGRMIMGKPAMPKK